MQAFAQYLKALRFPLAALFAALLGGAALIHYTGESLAAAQEKLQQQQKNLLEARRRYLKSGEEKSVITNYLERYQFLQEHGVIGAEQRINWLDALRSANREAELFGIEYRIGAQQPYARSAEFNAGRLQLNQSLMQLDFRLLHEEDLMRFFALLEKQQAGMFALNQCSLERLDGGAGAGLRPNLHAECELAWITIAPPS